MSETIQLIDLIGFDILFVGLVTILTFCLATSLFWMPPWMPLNGMAIGMWKFLGHFSGKPLVPLTALVICAAGVGNVLNVLSDELLDGGTLISSRAVLYVPSLDDFGELERWQGRWLEEDLLKAQALWDVKSRLDGPADIGKRPGLADRQPLTA